MVFVRYVCGCVGWIFGGGMVRGRRKKERKKEGKEIKKERGERAGCILKGGR